MNRVNQVVKLHLKSAKMWIVLPWVILGVNFLLTLLIAMSLSGDESLQTGSLSSIFVFTFVAGTLTLKETFPFAIGLSIRRKDYFLGTVMTVLYVNIFSAVGLTLLSTIEGATNGWNVNLHLFKVGFLSDISFVGMIGINFNLLIHLYFLGFAISSLHRRWGAMSLYIFFTAMLVVGTLTSYILTHFDLWVDLGEWIAHHYLELFWWMIPLVVIYALISYGLLRRAAV